MTKSAREMFKLSGFGKMTNAKVIKYGKIVENVAYEIVETQSYIDDKNEEKLYILSFVTEKNGEYIYDSGGVMSGTLQKLLEYIKICKKAKKDYNKKGE